MDLLADAAHVERIEGLHRAVGLAMGRAEGREVMPSDQMRGAFLHRVDIERHGDVPNPPRVERRRRAAIEDPIEILPPDTGEARVPVVGDLLDREHRNRVRADERIQPLAQPVRGQVCA